MKGAPLKDDAGREEYDLCLQLLLPAGILTAGTGDARGVTIGSPKWQLRESHSLKVHKYVKPKPISRQNQKLTQQHNWKKCFSSPREASIFVSLSVILSVSKG